MPSLSTKASSQKAQQVYDTQKNKLANDPQFQQDLLELQKFITEIIEDDFDGLEVKGFGDISIDDKLKAPTGQVALSNDRAYNFVIIDSVATLRRIVEQ